MEKISGTPEQLLARRKWVDALRSEKYSQASGRLRATEGTFCCLGVACDVSELGKWEVIPNDFSDRVLFMGAGYSSEHTLPDSVAKWLGISPEGWFGELSIDGNPRTSLWELNDYDHWSFEQIADLIEERFKVAPKEKVE